jgi:SAM-dependent methyltransferase
MMGTMGDEAGRAHVDWAARGPEMIEDAEVTAPMVDQALAWVAGRVPEARDVLDVGSGPGVAACTLGRLLPGARVRAVDGAPPLLALAARRAAAAGLADRFTTAEIDLPDGLRDLTPADIVWISGVVHHLPDPVEALRALGALVRPGGLLAVREGGLASRFLPEGVAPGLLPRLDALGEERVEHGDHPGGVVGHHGDWPDLMRQAGLEPAGSATFLLDLTAPLTPKARRYVRRALEIRRDFAGDLLSETDRQAADQLLDDDHPEGIMRRADLYLLGASTVHTAQPKRPVM